MKRLFAYIVLVFFSANLVGQTFNMPITGHLSTTSSNCTLYDNGGATGNYSSNCNASFTFYSTNNQSYVSISGTYDLEDCAKSKITIYDGGPSSTTELMSRCNNGSFNFCSNSSAITIKFRSDTDTPLSGFVINFAEVNCPKPTYLSYSNLTTDSVTLSWGGGTDSTRWVLECTTTGEMYYVDTTTLRIGGLSPYTQYCFIVRSDCSPISSCSYKTVCFRTACPCPKATNVSVYTDNNVMYVSWDEPDTSIIWEVFLDYNGVTIETDTNFCSFENVPTTIETFCVIINNLCTSTFDCNTSSVCQVPDPPPPFQCQCLKAVNPHVTNVQLNSAEIHWNPATASLGWIVEYWAEDSEQKYYDTVTTNFCALTNLIPATNYTCYIHSLCDSLDYRCAVKLSFFTYSDNCFNFLDIRGANCSAQYGTFEAPYENYGIIDYGPASATSRHTIHKNPLEKDIRTGDSLSTVPEGEIGSVRLGNWHYGAESESINYNYLIDTTNFDLLLLKYAIVLQTPNHTVNDQPRFTLSIIGENGRILDEICGYTNFYANNELGWNINEDEGVIWKDWTTMGVDLTSYHGQNIRIRLATFDCAEGGHYGYAYFTLSCASKYDSKRACGAVDSVTFTAPIGFFYQWYKENEPDNIISTDRKLSVLVNNSTFYCKCTSTENPYCILIMKYVAERNYPFSQFNYNINLCNKEVTFFNRSIVSNNDTIPIGNKYCDDTKWIYHNQEESTLDTVTFTYDSIGVYPVMLISKLNEGVCADTLIQDIVITNYYSDTIRAFICEGKAYTQNGFNETEQGIYSQNIITVNGCDSLIVLDLKFYSSSNDTIYDTICKGEVYEQHGFICPFPGTYTKRYETVNGCDSLITLCLTQVQAFDDYSIIDNKHIIAEDFPVVIDVTCEGCYNYYWNTGSTSPVLYINRTGSYYVLMYTHCGTMSDSVLVSVPEINIYFPNAFTPLKDNNNTFFPISIDMHKVYIEAFEIYNRWGERIYFSKTTAWDGKYKGKVVEDGVYIWRLLYKTKYTNDELFEKKGQLNLIK